MCSQEYMSMCWVSVLLLHLEKVGSLNSLTPPLGLVRKKVYYIIMFLVVVWSFTRNETEYLNNSALNTPNKLGIYSQWSKCTHKKD